VSALPPISIEESNDPLATPRRVALVRPDTRPAVRRREETYVMTFPHLVVREIILFQVVTIALSIAALLFDAPLQGIANPTETPNPAKAPWYFLGLQELLHYFPPVVAGVLLPGLVVIALVVIPYARINLSAGPLWARGGPRLLAAITTAIVGVAAFAALFDCWPVAVPTRRRAGKSVPARARRGHAPRMDHDLVRHRRERVDDHRHVLPRSRLVVRLALGLVPIVVKETSCARAMSSR